MKNLNYILIGDHAHVIKNTFYCLRLNRTILSACLVVCKISRSSIKL